MAENWKEERLRLERLFRQQGGTDPHRLTMDDLREATEGRTVDHLPREDQIALAKLAVQILRNADPPPMFTVRNRTGVSVNLIDGGRRMLAEMEISWAEEAKRGKEERDEAHRQAQIEEWGPDGRDA